MTREEARELIDRRRNELGERLIILGHHYQKDEVVEFCDVVGDSLELARKASQIEAAEIIVFCGVYFMAETASILAQDKAVYIPDPTAGCPLADMADIRRVMQAWEELSRIGKSFVPVTYVNSSAEIKAFCGRNSGTVCTSGNSQLIFEWALSHGETVFFMPDKNLGRNTAKMMGIPGEQIVQWDPDQARGGLTDDDIVRARVILWKGWCPVHWPEFAISDICSMRKQFPGIKIIVHPESDPETVEASDSAGSTAQILKYFRGLKPGDKVAVGTEFSMVKRAAKEYKSIIDIMALKGIYCEDMGKISLENLAATLTNLEGKEHRVVVPDSIVREAKKALDTMLRLSE